MRALSGIQEAKLDIPSIVAKAAKMTDHNDHTGARLYLASLVPSAKKLMKAYEGVQALQDFHGSLTSAVGKARDELDEKLHDVLYSAIDDKENFEAVWGAL